MRAIIQTRFGEPENVLKLRDIPTPILGDDEVLVRVRASGVAKGDWLITEGQPYIARPSYGFKVPKQPVAGLEMSGSVEAIGSAVKHLGIGDDVLGWCNGAFAEFVAVAEKQLVHKPVQITFEQAAALPISGFAALQAVRDKGEVQPGQRVLVVGASGGVGSIAVQIAKAHGAEVTGVCSTDNVELVRSLGADHVIDYTREDVDRDNRIYDVIVDIAGNRPIAKLRHVLAPEGTLVIVGGTGGPTTMGFGRTIRAMALSPFVRQRLRPLISSPNQADLLVLKDLIESGRLTPVVDEIYPLQQAHLAVIRAGQGRSRGKRIITV